jgi:UDP-N-acetylglucosamine 2-epimerase
MKIGPIVRTLDIVSQHFKYPIIHTGQHYDREICEVFFEELGIPKPDQHLECGGGGHPEQIAKIMIASWKLCTSRRPDCVLLVDDESTLSCIIRALNTIAQQVPLIFPVHPRAPANIQRFDLTHAPCITLTGRLSYVDFLNLWKDAAMVMTESGGLLHSIEQPITVDEGTNTLVSTDDNAIAGEAHRILDGQGKAGKWPTLWDGCSAERIVQQN